jgi:gamma-glutamyltranspeptidase
MLKLPALSGCGVVVAEHPLAALAGRDVLRQGGNFADAVVAISAMLSVVTPHLCGLGGDFFGLFWLAREKTSSFPQWERLCPERVGRFKLAPTISRELARLFALDSNCPRVG